MNALSTLSVELGHAAPYLSVLKNQNIEKFNFIFSFAENKRESIYKYFDYVDNLRDKCRDIYYEKDNAWFRELNLYQTKHPSLHRYMFSKTVFSSTEPLAIPLAAIRKMEKVLVNLNK